MPLFTWYSIKSMYVYIELFIIYQRAWKRTHLRWFSKIRGPKKIPALDELSWVVEKPSTVVARVKSQLYSVYEL